jgi:hypothetical protein
LQSLTHNGRFACLQWVAALIIRPTHLSVFVWPADIVVTDFTGIVFVIWLSQGHDPVGDEKIMEDSFSDDCISFDSALTVQPYR